MRSDINEKTAELLAEGFLKEAIRGIIEAYHKDNISVPKEIILYSAQLSILNRFFAQNLIDTNEYFLQVSRIVVRVIDFCDSYLFPTNSVERNQEF